MKMKCPECGKNHRAYPRQCYTAAINQYTHCVIANQASGKGICSIKEMGVCHLNCEDVKQKHNNMKKYVGTFHLKTKG